MDEGRQRVCTGMLVIERIELVLLDDGAEIMILNHQNGGSRLQGRKGADYRRKLLDVREHIGEGYDVGRPVRAHELRCERLAQIILDDDVPER